DHTGRRDSDDGQSQGPSGDQPQAAAGQAGRASGERVLHQAPDVQRAPGPSGDHSGAAPAARTRTKGFHADLDPGHSTVNDGEKPSGLVLSGTFCGFASPRTP